MMRREGRSNGYYEPEDRVIPAISVLWTHTGTGIKCGERRAEVLEFGSARHKIKSSMSTSGACGTGSTNTSKSRA